MRRHWLILSATAPENKVACNDILIGIGHDIHRKATTVGNLSQFLADGAGFCEYIIIPGMVTELNSFGSSVISL